MLQECQTQGLAHTQVIRESKKENRLYFPFKASEMKLPIEEQETSCMKFYIITRSKATL